MARVGVVDRWLEPADLAAAREVMARSVDVSDVRLAFVSGSLAAGLGHPLSDIDLYVVTGDEAVTPRSTRERDRVVQLNVMADAEFDRVRRICSRYEVTPSERWQTELDVRSLTLAVRLAIGTVLVDNGADLPPDIERRRVMRRVLLTRAAILISTLAEDVLGARELGDAPTQLVASRMALIEGIEAALIGADDVYLGPKFLFRRMLRTEATAPLANRCWELLRDPAWPPSGDSVEDLADRRLRLAAGLAAVAALEGWDEPLRGFADQVAAAAPSDGPRRSPWFCPIRYGDLWGLAGPDRGLRVSEGAVRLWAELDGTPRDQVRDRLRRSVSGFADLAEDAFEAGVQGLVSTGAAESG